MIETIVDIKAFENFFNEYYMAVLRYATTIVGDSNDAEDIVQQVFVTMWQNREEIAFTTSARAYLYKSVYNASLDYLKHEKIKKKYINENAIGTNTEYQDGIIANEMNKRIEKAIQELPEQCRRIFIMSRKQRLKYKEIAVALAISEKTVENQMGKALRLLRQSLRQYLLILIISINLFPW